MRQHSQAIVVDQLSHHYHSGGTTTLILKDINFHIDAGEIVALIGRSGSGKSTLLNLISGLEPIVDGDVIIRQQAQQAENHEAYGQSMKALNDHDRTLLRGKSIGFIYQAFNLISTLSVSDNIALPMALTGISARQQKQAVTTRLKDVGLADRDNDFPDRLSGGEQQRVAIARALAHAPPLILADEPTGNLDAASGRQVMQLLSSLVRQQGAAMLLVTHSKEVASLADRILQLEQTSLTESTLDTFNNSSAW